MTRDRLRPAFAPPTRRDRAPRSRWRRVAGAGALALALGSWTAASAPPPITPGLLERARVEGTALVIVTVRVPPGAAAAEMEAVKRAVLTGVAHTRHRVVRELKSLPQLVLEASEDTLRALVASPDVARVDESIPRPPLR